MIIHKLKMGRFGNQLFQIAAALAHAQNVGTIAQFPKWEYNKYFINGINDNLDQTFDCIFNGIFHNPHWGLQFHYQPIPLEKNLVLHGFYQSEKYFSNQKEVVINAFKPKNEFLQIVREAGKEFLHLQNTVAVHIRRTDYIDLKDAHPVLSETDYYRKALVEANKIHFLDKQGKGRLNVIVFSDDINWCKANFTAPSSINEMFFVSGNSNIIDLFLMAQCENHIIANSSFSWWGAWLSKNMFEKNGFTIAPKQWFGERLKDYNTKDLYLEEWVKVS